MSAPRFDFEVDTYTGDIQSIEAKAMVGGSTWSSDVTLHAVPGSGSSVIIPIAVRVIGPASATLTDGSGGVHTIVASPTGDAVPFDVSVPAGTTFSITSTVTTMTSEPKATNQVGEKGPRPAPPSNKKAIIKPITRCPG